MPAEDQQNSNGAVDREHAVLQIGDGHADTGSRYAAGTVIAGTAPAVASFVSPAMHTATGHTTSTAAGVGMEQKGLINTFRCSRDASNPCLLDLWVSINTPLGMPVPQQRFLCRLGTGASEARDHEAFCGLWPI